MTDQSIRDELAATIHENFNACRGRNGVSPDALAAVILASPVIRRIQAEAWGEGHQRRWRRGPDGCHCGAWSSTECACGEYGTGRLESLDDNPYRKEQP